jgi:calcium binding protein 39
MRASDVSTQIRGVLEHIPSGSMFERLCEQCLRGKASDMIAAILDADAPARIFDELSTLDFEGQKMFAALFSDMLEVDRSMEIPSRFSQYLQSHPQLISQMLAGFGSPDISLHCSAMLRSCARDESLAKCLLKQNALARCIDLAQHSQFEISCEAFALLHELLLPESGCCRVAAEHLKDNAKSFFEHYRVLLESSEYATQRQALKHLGCLLLHREFKEAMQVYIQDMRYLKIHMNLMLSKSTRIQHDNFHIFKVFVANPWKPDNVARTLVRNKPRLAQVLESYNKKIEGDNSFMQDLTAVLQILRGMSEPVA